MPSKSRPDPVIPDHEILRKIGGGAYGEVWLGRGVTGALRAVKVVWREDFDDARGFEREFEGILKFEPISRDHPGLVHILHVGRSPDGVSFYYYVMELGDDVRAGQEINPIEYEPRTLRADTKHAINPQLDTATCIDVGLRLAEALDHLHERGLAHRDVKPSNVIFLNGRAKLADIGLVAARDQRTFVGTEGFVPPEGPGSAQADVYSLGKVLYEIATGKDRLDFPELPDSLPSGSDRKRWLELNRIICDICEPRLSKRMITTASGLAEALKRIQKGKKRRRGSSAVWITTLLLLGFSGWAGWEVWKSGDWRNPWTKKSEPVVQKMGKIKVVTQPEGARVFDEKGRFIDITPTRVIEDIEVGKMVRYKIELDKYQSLMVEGKVTEDLLLIQETLKPDQPPEEGLVWSDHLKNRYAPIGKNFESVGHVTAKDWVRFSADTSWKAAEYIPYSEDGNEVTIALATKDEAIAFCSWLRGGAIQSGLLTDDYEVVPNRNVSFTDKNMSESARSGDRRPFTVIVRKIEFGMVQLKTEPPGAEVYINGVYRGIANGEVIDRVPPGETTILLNKEGFEQLFLKEKVTPGETLVLEKKLQGNLGVVFEKPWANSLEMKFVPLGRNLMVSIWETRVRDYKKYVEMNQVAVQVVPPEGEPPRLPVVMPEIPEFKQDENHPIVFVSRDEAEAFCRWLTDHERREGRITSAHEYRLPTDLEWSRMAGLEYEIGADPSKRDLNKEPGGFPWGNSWPPTGKAGNLADTAAALGPGMTRELTISGYNDEHPFTATVGAFAPNELGIYDLSGNAQEWVLTDYQSADNGPVRDKGSPTGSLGVLRGGGWDTFREMDLYTGSRSPASPGYGGKSYGFRVVLSKIMAEPQSTPLDGLAPTPPEPDIPAQ